MNAEVFGQIVRYIDGHLEGLSAEDKFGLLEDLLVHLENKAELASDELSEEDWEEK